MIYCDIVNLNEFAQALWICDTGAPEHLDTQGVLQRRRRCCAPTLASPGPDGVGVRLWHLSCCFVWFLAVPGLQGNFTNLGTRCSCFRNSLTLGLKLPGWAHCVQRCPKCWLFVSVSFLLQPDWLPLRHPQPFVIWRCEILEPLRCHRYSISRFPVRVRVQTSVNEGFATTGHTPAEGMKSWRYYEKIWTVFAYSSCDVLQEFHLFSIKFEYNFGVSRHMYAQITEASNRWHARWDLCSM